MRKSVVLITGAGGEIGHALVRGLADTSSIITLDVNPLDAKVSPFVRREFTGSIMDTNLLDRILAEFEVDCVYHLAALLSTRAEFTPVMAHHVNVEGTLNLLEFDDPGRPWLQWGPWFSAQGLPAARPQGVLHFNQYDQVIQAALAGQGVALGRLALIRPLLDDGRLVCVGTPDGGGSNRHAYWLIQAEAAPREEVRRVADWVRAEAAATA